MPSTTVRISDKSRKLLRELAAREGKSMQVILEKVIEEYRRQRFLEDVNAAYAALRQDPETWARVKQEQATWDGTLIDGLDPGEVWTENGEVIRKNKGEKRS